MDFERKIDYKEKDPFQYDHLHFHPVIDEELVLKLMKAIESQNEVLITSNNKYRRYNDEPLKPVKLRYDIECGRFYVIGFYNDRCIAVRLDKKDEVKILKSKFDYDKYLEKYKKSMDKSFSSVPLNDKNTCNNVKFELTINNDEDYLISKIKGELGECSFERIEKNKFIIRKEVNDGWEMIPWIRKYGENIKVIEPAALRKRFKEDWEAMLNNYGIIS